MSNLPPFQTQYNKIIDAYFKDEIKPLYAKFCFCGTLCNNTSKWFYSPRQEHRNSHGYIGAEFVYMEKALLDTMYLQLQFDDTVVMYESHPKYESALFDGMVAALSALREIHISRGQVIDEAPVFNKRFLKGII